MPLLLLSLALAVLLVLQQRAHSKERDRLVRLAAANTPAERIAALLPEKRTSAPREERPTKPLGI